MIIFINGKLRQGKGVLMSLFGLYALDSGIPVLSNYHLLNEKGAAHPLNTYIDFYDLVTLLKNRTRGNGRWILIDELQGWLDAYISQSKTSRFGGYFLFQSGKLGWNIIFTSQRTMRADINWREMCDIRWKATKFPDHFRYDYLDMENLEDDLETGRNFKIPFEAAKHWWNRYDTYEPVIPLGMDELFVEMEKYDSQRLNATVDRQAASLTERFPTVRAWTTGAARNALLLLGEPICFAAYVCERLKMPAAEDRKPLPTQADTDNILASVPLSGWRRLRSKNHR